MAEVFGWNPFAELDALRREMDRLFEELPRTLLGESPRTPPVNVWQGTDGVALVVSLPGYKPDDVEITCSGRSVTIRGKREPATLQPGEVRRVDERFHGEFSRTLELPFEVDPDRATATFSRGLLLVSLQCAEKDRPKRIPVKPAGQ